MECTLSVIRQSSLILTGVAIPPLLMRIEKMKHITFENCCSNESVIHQLPPNMLIGEIDELQQVMYAFGAGNFKLEY